MDRKILDPASGSRMFYFDKNDSRVVFGDIRNEYHVLCDGRELNVNPDVLMDFREIPFPAETFKLVIFDPPHMETLGENSWMAKKYGRLNRETWRDDLRRGFSECFRVLENFGILVFKWNETDIPLKQILELTEEKPIAGHISGKRSGTHWVVFMKQNT